MRMRWAGLIICLVLTSLAIISLANSTGELRVYSDGGVSISYRYPSPAPVNYDVRIIHGIHDTEVKALVTSPIRPYYEEQDFRINATVSVVRTTNNTKIVDEVIFNALFHNSTDSVELVAVDPISIVWDVEVLKVFVSGSITILGRGVRGENLADYVYSLITEEYVSSFIQEVSRSTAVLTGFKKEVVGNARVISFSIEIDISKAIQGLREHDVSAVKELLYRFAYPSRTNITVSGVRQVFDRVDINAKFSKNTNEIIRDLVSLYEFVKQFNATSVLLVAEPWLSGVGAVTLYIYGELASEFIKEFEVMPSETVWRVTGNFTSGMTEYRLPKIMKKNASSPTETIVALHSFILRIPDIVARVERTYFNQYTPISNFIRVGVSQFMNASARVVADENVKVLKDGKEVNEVLFKDLAGLEVLLPEEPAKETTSEEASKTVEAPLGSLTTVLAVLTVVLLASVAIVLKLMRRT
ncbi:MAG: hypothetical protein QW290_02625 [Sulfolobales archaeon]